MPENSTVDANFQNAISDARNNAVKQWPVVSAILILIVLAVVIATLYKAWEMFGFNEKYLPANTIQNKETSTDSISPVIKNNSIEHLTQNRYKKLAEIAIKSGKSIDTSSLDKLTQADPTVINEINNFESDLRTTETTYINAEVVTLWFNNFYKDKYSLDERKKMAYEIMTDLRTRVASGEITMKEAGDTLINDVSLEDIDTAWKSNAYRNITYAKKNSRSFLDPKVESEFWNTQVGELSPLLISNMPDAPGNPEGSYLFFKINEREDKEYDSYEEVMESFK